MEIANILIELSNTLSLDIILGDHLTLSKEITDTTLINAKYCCNFNKIYQIYKIQKV